MTKLNKLHERVMRESSYNDFVSKYGREFEDNVKDLSSFGKTKFSKLDEDKQNQIADKVMAKIERMYDKNIWEYIEAVLFNGRFDMRVLFKVAVENQDKYGTEPQQFSNAFEDALNMLRREIK